MKQDKDDFVKLLVKYQLALAGLDWSVTEQPEWFSKNTITEDKHKEWKDFCIEKIRKYLNCSKLQANKEFGWIDLSFGMKIAN